jgi:RHS repeat-associated protein
VHEISETIETGQTNKVTFVYDRFGRDSIKTYNDSYAESYVYNNNGYLDQILFNGTVVYDVSTMDVRGNITAASIGGTSASWGYNAYGQLTSSAASGVQGYSYSPNTTTGNMTSRTNSLKSLSETFYYDNLDRLGSVSGPGGSLNIGYDSISNLIYKSDAGSFFYDNGKPYQLSNVIPPANFPEIPQNINYTAFGKISSISEGVNSATFKYNSDKQRVKMSFTANGLGVWTKYYFGSSYEKVIESSATTEYIWIGGSPYTAVAVAKIVNGGTPQVWAIFRDHLGTITHLKNGSTIYEYSFDAWGRRRDKDNWSYTLSGEPALFANRGFTGHEHLTEFGLINMNGRLYDPLVGRFLSPDNYVQSPDFTQNFNRYGYCLNNPLRYTDPDGEIIFTIIGALLAPVTGGASLAIGIGMDITAAINVASNWNDINGVVGDGKINGGKLAAYYGIGSLNGAAAATGQAWAIGLTGSATSLLNSTVKVGGFKNIGTEHLVNAAIDGAISFGGAKLTLPNSGESLLGLNHSSSNLNLSGKISSKFGSWGKTALGSYLSDQVVKYPYTFLTGSLKYRVLSGDPNNMWKVGFNQANMGAIYDFGGMAYQSSINMQYSLYRTEHNFRISLDLSIQKANTPSHNYTPSYSSPIQKYFYMPSVSPYLPMNFD